MPDDTNRSSPLVRKFFEEYYSDKNRKKLTAYLGTGESGSGFLKTHNTLGVMTGYFGTNQDNDGIVTLSDRYGDKGWRKSGKQ